MASLLMSIVRLSLLLVVVLSAVRAAPMSSLVFEVGGKAGWAVPPAKETEMYNEWASRNRFQIGDTLDFKYDKDSVMEVSEEDYDKCNSAHPIFFSNNGNTLFKFDRSGTYYFISGVSGHCTRGQKMIIKVMGHSEGPSTSPPSSGNHTAGPGPPGPSDHSSASPVALSMALLHFLLFFMGHFF